MTNFPGLRGSSPWPFYNARSRLSEAEIQLDWPQEMPTLVRGPVPGPVKPTLGS
jgi:hypothetical protein